MKFSYCQLTALMFAVLAVTPCACKKTQNGSDGVSNDDATDEVATLQVHVHLSTMPTPIQSWSYGNFTDESNTFIEKIEDANTMTKAANSVKETNKASIQAIAKRKPLNISDVLANTASGRILKHIIKEDDLHPLLTRQAIPQNRSLGFSDVLFSIASGASLKIFLGLDDLVWLGPMIASSTSRIGKCRIVMIYGFATLLVVACAVYLGAFIDKLGNSVESLSFWVSIVAGALLMIYSTYMAYSEGWFARCGLLGDDDDDEDDACKAECSDAKAMTFS